MRCVCDMQVCKGCPLYYQAGSSSPVSSISGFSSNSHFDEEGKDRPDPFASALNDPFNAFLSSGSGDLFGSAGRLSSFPSQSTILLQSINSPLS